MSANKQYLESLLRDAQKARSVFFEAHGRDEIAEKFGEFLEPYLFGEKNIVPFLVKTLEADEIDNVVVVNFSHIARYSYFLGIVKISGRKHDPTIGEIFGIPNLEVI